MSEALSSIGTALGGSSGGSPNWMKLLLGGLTGAGEIGNISADRQRADLLKKQQSWANLTPQQLSAKVAAATQPLNAGLVQSVGNTVQADVAGRGLAESPGIFSAVMGQALAPYEQQNQNTALNAILAQMGVPGQGASLLPGQTQLGPLMALLLKSFQGGSSGPNMSGVSMGPAPNDNTDWLSQIVQPPTAAGATP